METKTQTQIEKKSYQEFTEDFLEFQAAKDKFIKKHASIISGFRTERSIGKIELTLIFDGEKQEEQYDMRN